MPSRLQNYIAQIDGEIAEFEDILKVLKTQKDTLHRVVDALCG